MAHKVGDTVTVTRGPHKGEAHKVIHVHSDGRVNVKPHKKMPHQIKYRHGAATAKSSEVRKMSTESIDEIARSMTPMKKKFGDAKVRSNRAMHSHENEAQKKAHAAHMKKKHNVTTKYHGDDEVSYHGTKKNVRKALGNHYGGDHDHAKEEHPHIYKEGTIITKPGFKMTDNDKEKLQKIQKMLKRDKAVAKKSTHPGPNEDEDKPVHIVRSKKGTAQLHRISRNDNKLIRKEDVDEACWDSHKQVGYKMKGGRRVPNCVPKNENQKAALMKKLAKSAQSSEKGKKAVTLKKAPFRIPSKDDMKNEGAMKRIATSQSSKPDRMAGKGLDTFKKKPPEKNEVLDKDKDHMSYRQKAKYSMDRARNSATAKIVRGKGDDIDKEKNTLRKRSAGMAMSDRKGVRQFRKFHGYDKKK
jgi:hypothetical protein